MAISSSMDVSPKLSRRLSVGSDTYGFSITTRLVFYVGYYVLCCAFAADLSAVILTLPVFAICCFNILKIRSNYATTQDMIWFVLYMCFAIAPCQTLRLGYFDDSGPASGLYFEDAEIITAEAIVVVFLLVATITTRVFTTKDPVERNVAALTYDLKDGIFPLVCALSVAAFAVYLVLVGGLGNMLADRYTRAETSDISPVAVSFQALQSVTCLLACAYLKRKPRKSLIASILTFVVCGLVIALLAASQNPFNAARFFLLMTWLPVCLVFCSGKIKVSTFYLGTIVGLLIFMPILNFTGRFGMSIGEAAQNVDISEFIFKVPYIDVFDMLVYEVRYLHSEGFYWGGKTLSILLFFVPREFWTGKETLIAKDIGAQLVEMGTAGTDNLSLFFAGEFYADLGFVGVAIGAFLVALLLSVFGSNRPVTINGLDIRSFISIAAVPIIIRGPIGAVLPLFFMDMVLLAILTPVLCNRIDPVSNTKSLAG